MIIFHKIRWKNFLSYGNVFTEVELDRAHTTILTGISGSGKSTLCDALSFVLYNRPFRNINKTQLPNSINESDCLVEIEFSVGTRAYKVRRGIKPNVFEIYCNGIMINQDSNSRDYQLMLERQVLQMNYKSFTQIVVLGASNFIPFMKLKPGDRRSIIEELLDIEIFSTMNGILKQKMMDNRSSMTLVQYNQNMVNEKIKIHEQYIEDLTKDRDAKIKQNKNTIEELTEQISSLKGNIKYHNNQIEFHESKVADEDDVDRKQGKFRTMLNKLQFMANRHSKDIEFYETHDTCPKCKQSIDANFKKNEVSVKKAKFTELWKGIDTTNDVLAKLDSRLQKIYKTKKEISNLESEINKLQAEIRGHEHIISRLEKENQELAKPKGSVGKEQQTINELKKEIAKYNNEYDKLILNRSVYEVAATILKDGGVKSKIIKQYLPIINKHLNQFLQSMQFFVTFDIDEEFKESIKSRGRDLFSYESFSEGERQRIDASLLFTWRAVAKLKNSVNTNLLIMDEILDSYLDQEATENILESFKTAQFKNTNIFVISHKGTISDKFDKQLTFEKVKNFSRIET